MAQTVYILCSLASLICAILLYRGYRKSRLPLLFWSGLCFVLLALGNMLLIVDMVLFPTMDLTIWRSSITLAGLAVLLYGLIFKSNSP